MRLQPGRPAPEFHASDLTGHIVRLADYWGKPLLLSFYRSAACPLCSLRLWYLRQQYAAWHAAGLEVIGVFETSAQTTLEFAGMPPPPFPVIPEGRKDLFQRFGVETNAALIPWGVVKNLGGYWQAWRKRVGGRISDGNLGLLPADFLLNPDLTIHTAYYGRDIGDHLPFTAIADFATSLQFARTQPRPPQR
jgi:peroxiredoxin